MFETLTSGRHHSLMHCPGFTPEDRRDRNQLISKTNVGSPISFGAPVFQAAPNFQMIDGVSECVSDNCCTGFITGGSFIGFSVTSDEFDNYWPSNVATSIIVKGRVQVRNPARNAAIGASVYLDSFGNVTAANNGIFLPNIRFETRVALISDLAFIRLG